MKQYADVIICGNDRTPFNWYFPPQLTCFTTPPTVQNCIKSRQKLRTKNHEIFDHAGNAWTYQIPHNRLCVIYNHFYTKKCRHKTLKFYANRITPISLGM